MALHPLLGLCEASLAAMADGLPPATRVNLRAGARLFERGVRGDAIYVLKQGVVKETMPGPDGGRCIVRLVVPGGVTALCALLGVPHSHSGYVLHAGMACRIPVERINRMLDDHPDLVDRLLQDWQQAIDDADRILGDFGHGPGRARLARVLLYLRKVVGPCEPLRLRRNELADLLAISPVSVARLLGDFRREGLIVEDARHCMTLDEACLRAVATERA